MILVLSLINTLNNLRQLRGSRSDSTSTSIAILIPARNEEANIGKLLSSLSQQKDVENFTVTILDDNSTDDTAQVISKFTTKYINMSMLSGREIPAGWLGKNYACHQLAVTKLDAEILIFIDADVYLEPNAIATAVNQMRQNQSQFISPYPRQIARSWSEYLIQPLLQWSWLSTLPLKLARNSKRPSLTAANGQFFVVSSSAYIASGGHKEIKNELLDDIELAKALKRAGFSGGVSNGAHIASCRMYQNWPELRAGYQKSLWRAFNSIPGALAVALVLVMLFIFPIFQIISGSGLGIIAYLLMVLSRIIAAKVSRGSLTSSFLHPVSILLFIYLLTTSWIHHLRGDLWWKGRKV